MKYWRSEGEEKQEFWKSGSHVRAPLPALQHGGTLERAPPCSSMLRSQRMEESRTRPCSSAAPCTPTCLSQREKNKMGLPALFTLISLSSPGLSLFSSPNFSHMVFLPYFATIRLYLVTPYRTIYYD